MANAFGYVRVSTDEQAREGESLDAQRARIIAAAAAAGDHLVDVLLDDGRSAKNLKRPGLQALLGRMRAGEAERLWATKLDRVTRRPADLEYLFEHHFGADAPHRLMLANEPHDAKTPAGRLTLRILCAIGQHELEVTSERTRTIVDHKRADGRVVGGLPLGFDRDGDKLVPNAGEQAILARARELRGAGVGYHTIARTLADEGHKTKRGGSWRACTVAKLLERAE
jgi:site-specific DNA recombinase